MSKTAVYSSGQKRPIPPTNRDRRKKSAQPHPFAAGSAALRSLLAATPEYEVEMWVDDFTMDVFRQDRDLFLVGLDKQPLFDMEENPLTLTQFMEKDVVQTSLLDTLALYQ